MKEITHHTPVGDMAQLAAAQGQALLKSHAGGGPIVAAPAPVAAAPAPAPAPRSLLKGLLGSFRDLVKSHVDQFTRKDGTVVQAHDTKVQAKTPLQKKGFQHQPQHQDSAGQEKGAPIELTGKAAHHEKKLGLPAGALAPDDDGYSKTHVFNGPGGTKHSVYSSGGKVRVRPHGDDAKHKAAAIELMNHMHGGLGLPKQAGGTSDAAAREATQAAFAKPGAGAPAAAPAADAPAGAEKPATGAPGGDAGPSAGIPPDDHLDQMESSLANDEDSSPEELVDFFVKECGIDPAHAKAAVALRDHFQGTAMPKAGLLKELMTEKAAAGGTGNAKADAALAAGKKAGDDFAAQQAANKGNGVPTDPAAFKSGDAITVGGQEHEVDKAVGQFVKTKSGGAFKPSQMEKHTPAGAGGGGDVPREAQQAAPGAGPVGDPPPQADSNEAGWDELPDEDNPKHALSGMSSKQLGALATAKPEHVKAHAHAELANRGLDSTGEWRGFDGANKHHAGSMPTGFKPDPGTMEHMQTVKRKVLTAAATGHLDLQKRAKHELANRGHDHGGNWIGFEKAKAMHLGGGKPAGAMAKAGGPGKVFLVLRTPGGEG